MSAALVVAAAVLLWLPFELEAPLPLLTVAGLAILLLVALYPGVLGMLAQRSANPNATVVIGALTAMAPLVVASVWDDVVLTIKRPGVFLPSATDLALLAVAALAPLAGAAVAARYARQGRLVRAFVMGGAVEWLILAAIMVRILMII